MNDKAKCKNCTDEMIEEMAKEIFNTCAWRFGHPNDYKEIFNDIAKDIFALDYRKILEGSVVLSKEEFDEDYVTKQDRDYWKNKTEILGNKLKQARKETAKEIFENLYTWLRLEEISKYGFVSIQKFDFLRKFREIIKQYGVEE